jgi:hypothetical protein
MGKLFKRSQLNLNEPKRHKTTLLAARLHGNANRFAFGLEQLSSLSERKVRKLVRRYLDDNRRIVHRFVDKCIYDEATHRRGGESSDSSSSGDIDTNSD